MPRSSRSNSAKRTSAPRRAEGKRPQDALPKFDETVVRETDRTVPVEPVKRSRKANAPLPEPALDHRRQIVRTDEPKGRTR